MAMAKTLIDQMTVKWDPEKYKDEYKSSLLKVIEKKAESGGHESPAPKKAARPATNVVDLTEVLRRSLGKRRLKNPKKSAPAPRGR